MATAKRTAKRGGKEGGAARPTLLWLRRDLRLTDHPALTQAVARGAPVIPVFIVDPVMEAEYGAAALWRLSKSLEAFSSSLEGIGGRLILRRGDALACLRALVEETGAEAVFWSRLYDPASIDRDTAVKSALREDGVEAESHPGWLLFEPHRVKTKTGDFFKVYTPFWRAASALEPPAAPLPAPGSFPAPSAWPESLTIADLGLEDRMNRGGAVVGRHVAVGEIAARERLIHFVAAGLAAYTDRRDRLDMDGTSRLSAHFATGELSPRQAWAAAHDALLKDPSVEAGATTFMKEIVWREFAWHLLFHTPHIQSRNWRDQWDAFPWRQDNADAERWRRGRTGIAVVDAAMRELYVTGTMHNRARMLVGSYLTKNLLTHWRVGEAWFRDCLVDWDPASNAMGWQWVAGSGPDAAPFFRIFNPETQAEKFDPQGAYVAKWLPEARRQSLLADGDADASPGRAFFDACPRSWKMAPDDPYPSPVASLADGRTAALAAYKAMSGDKKDSAAAQSGAKKPASTKKVKSTQGAAT